jgi:hypothetical protein
VYHPTLEDADENHEGNFSEAVNKRLRWSFGDKAYTNNNSNNGLQQRGNAGHEKWPLKYPALFLPTTITVPRRKEVTPHHHFITHHHNSY